LACHETRLRVKAILNNSKNEILFYGFYDIKHRRSLKLPEGIVEYGEAPEITLKRLMREIANIEVEPLALLGVYTKFDSASKNNCESGHVITLVFVCLILDFKKGINETKNSQTCLWLNKKAIESQFLMEETDNKILKDYVAWRIDKSTFWTNKRY